MNKNIKKSLQWLLRHALTVLSCVVIIALGMGAIAYSSTSTTIGENISTGGTLTVSSDSILATTTISGGDLIVDTDTFIVDNDNNRVGIGTTAPTSQLTQASTLAYESAPISSTELTDDTGWTSTDWTGDYANGFTHTTGNTSDLSRTVAISSESYYQISFAISDRTAGSITVALGYATTTQTYSGAVATTTYTVGPKTLAATGDLTFIPTSDFNGKISAISVKEITGTYNPIYAMLDAGGNAVIEMRSSSSTLSNTFIGRYAGSYNTTGLNNSAMGMYALYSNTTGSMNSAMGNYALNLNTTGIQNSAMGNAALYSNTTGSNNSAMGMAVLYSNTTGSYNSAIGDYTLYANTTGSYNSAVGREALRFNTTGSYNSAMGIFSLRSNTTGSNNVALGYYAGAYELGSNAFYVDNQNRTNTAGDKANALLYGTFASTAANQLLTINAKVGINSSAPLHALDVYGDCIAWNGTCINTTAPSNVVSYIGSTFKFAGTSNFTTQFVTRYIPYGGGTAGSSNIYQVSATRAGTIQNLYINASANTFSGTVAFTVQKNGVDTGITAQLSGSGVTTASDTVNTVTVAAGDRLGVKMVTSAGSGTLTAPFSISFEEAVTTNVFSSQWTGAAGGDIYLDTGRVGIGTSTPTTQLQVANSSSNATSTLTVGKENQNKGTCLELFDSVGTAVYAYVAAGATTFTLSTVSCK